MKLIKNVNKAVKNYSNKIEIELLDEINNKNKLKINNYPALVINDKIISQGKVLTEKEIVNYIKILI